jgi:hypothetical protein
MTYNYIESLEKLFNSSTSLSSEELQGFFNESLQFLRQLQGKMVSSDEKSQEEALQTSLAMQEQLQSKLQAICDKHGIDFTQLTTLVETMEHTTSDERKMMEEMEKKFQEFKDEGDR